MVYIGLYIYPTDPIGWIKIEEEGVVCKKFDRVILRLEDGIEEACTIVKVASEEEFEKIKANDTKMTDLTKAVYLRHATENDLQKIHSNESRVAETLESCNKIIKEHALDMQLITCHFSFSGKQVMFVFTAEGRVDFRDLVKDLVKAFQKQIRLKQIGPRDRARLIKGYGKCGRTLCCATHLEKLDSVTMEMARVQNLHSKGSSKISGICGKLLCCLSYEIKLYEELRSKMPEVGSIVKYNKDEGVVIGLDVLNQTLKIKFQQNTVDNIAVSKISVIKKAAPEKAYE